MTIAAKIASIRRTVELLAELDDPDATLTAAALSGWLAGQDFNSAAGLVPRWHSHLQLSARDRALGALVVLQSDISTRALAAWIVEGFDRVGTPNTRPDGVDGYLVDLARAGCVLSQHQWRRLISDVRGASRLLNAPPRLRHRPRNRRL